MTEEHVAQVCKPGSSACCRYLTMSANGWTCEKFTSLKPLIDQRVADGTFNAKGDNCPGVRNDS